MNPETASVLQDTLQFVDLTSQVIKQASDQLGVFQLQQKKAMTILPKTVTALVEAGLIPAAREKEASLLLGNPDGALDMLMKVAERYGQLAQQEKSAAAKTTRNVGQPADPEKLGFEHRASDSMTADERFEMAIMQSPYGRN